MSTVPAHDVMVESIASQRAKSGLLMFTASMELVHMNQEAMVLGSHINQARMRRAASGVLPGEVFALCEEIVKLLGRQRDAKEWEHFELRRMAGLPCYSADSACQIVRALRPASWSSWNGSVCVATSGPNRQWSAIS